MEIQTDYSAQREYEVNKQQVGDLWANRLPNGVDIAQKVVAAIHPQVFTPSTTENAPHVQVLQETLLRDIRNPFLSNRAREDAIMHHFQGYPDREGLYQLLASAMKTEGIVNQYLFNIIDQAAGRPRKRDQRVNLGVGEQQLFTRSFLYMDPIVLVQNLRSFYSSYAVLHKSLLPEHVRFGFSIIDRAVSGAAACAVAAKSLELMYPGKIAGIATPQDDILGIDYFAHDEYVNPQNYRARAYFGQSKADNYRRDRQGDGVDYRKVLADLGLERIEYMGSRRAAVYHIPIRERFDEVMQAFEERGVKPNDIISEMRAFYAKVKNQSSLSYRLMRDVPAYFTVCNLTFDKQIGSKMTDQEEFFQDVALFVHKVNQQRPKR